MNQWKLRYTYAKVEVKSDHAKALRDGLEQVALLWPPATLFLSDLETLNKKQLLMQMLDLHLFGKA